MWEDATDDCVFSFFFQAEDGIRDLYVTGVQTCAHPIYAEYVILKRAVIVLGRYACGVVFRINRFCSSAGRIAKIKRSESTRLNSSHVEISYAVFCLKKKNRGYRPEGSADAARPGQDGCL